MASLTKRTGWMRGAWDDAKAIRAMLRDYKRGAYRRVPWWSIAAVVLAVAYVINPFDLVPDAIPVLGQIDDAAVLAACLKLVRRDIARYRAEQTA